jgi:peroxiredoxin
MALPAPLCRLFGLPALGLTTLGLAALVLAACGGGILNSDPDAARGPVPVAGVARENLDVPLRRAPIRPGEETPALVLNDQTGRPVSTLEVTAGGDALLIFIPTGSAPTSRPVFEWLRRNAYHATDRRCEVLLVTPDTPGENTRLAAEEGLRLAILSDPSAWGARTFGFVSSRDANEVSQPWSVLIGREGKVLSLTRGLWEPSELVTELFVRRGAQERYDAIDLFR